MRVAVFADTFAPQINGVANTLNNLVRYFEENNIEYKLFVPRYDNEKDFYQVERFYSLKFFLYPESRITLPNTFRINQTLAGFKPDIIHLMTEFNMGLAGLFYGRKFNIPIVSNYTTNYSQYTNYYKLKFMEQSIWNYLKWFHTQSDITLCPSHTTQKLLSTYSITNTAIFSRGIDSKKFAPCHKNPALRKELGIENKVTFLYVGRISPEKDLDILCESYIRIKDRYGDQAALILTGDGPYRKKCESMFPSDVIYTGFRQGRELAEIYASADIFVCPSSTETFGNVVLEALTSGLAVIGADAGGVGDMIEHRRHGLKFQPRNTDELTNYMEELLLDIDLRDYLKESAREYGLAHSWHTILDDLMGIYEDILNKQNMEYYYKISKN